MKPLTLYEESILICLKTIQCSDFGGLVALVRWSDDLEKQSRKRYDNRPKPMRGYDEDPRWLKERRRVSSTISWARGIAFGKMLSQVAQDSDRYQKIMERIKNF